MTDSLPPAARPSSVNAIVACDENRLIGRAGRLPWRIREDWNWFMGHTLGGACVIGRVSYEAMLRGGHIDEKRRFYVVTSNKALENSFAEVFSDSSSALAAAKHSGLPVWICGGSRIYTETFPACERLYLTRIHARVPGGDAWIDDWTPFFADKPVWSRQSADGKFGYSFEVYDRR